MKRRYLLWMVQAAWMSLLGAAPAWAGMSTLNATLDTSLYDSPNPQSNPISNGAGQFLFSGTTGVNNHFETRRALLAFDVASMVPPNAVVESATIQLVVTRSPPGAGNDTFTLHQALAPWGEGTSDPSGNEGVGTMATPGDATWLHRDFPGAFWTTPGGDFDPAASATAAIGPQGLPYLLYGPGLVRDVQGWIDDPASNYGWFLLGEESGSKTVRQFGSREHPDEDSRPTLTLTYRVIPEPTVLGLLAVGAATLWLRLTRGRNRPKGKPS